MNTPLIFPFKNCDHSDENLEEIQNYRIGFEQGYNEHQEFYYPNKPVTVESFSIADNIAYTTSEWDTVRDYIEPNGTFNGDTITISDILKPNREYWAKIKATKTAGTITLNIGGNPVTIDEDGDYFISEIADSLQADDDVTIVFSSDFEGKFYNIEISLTNEQFFRVTDDDCDSFTDVTGTKSKDSILLQPFATNQTQSKEYILEKTDLNDNYLGNRLSLFTPDEGNNYSVVAGLTEGIDIITYGNAGAATSNANTTNGQYYRLEFKYNGVVSVEVGSTLIASFDTSLGDSGIASIDFIGNGSPLVLNGEDNTIHTVVLKEHLPEYSVHYDVYPIVSENCGEDDLVKLRWRHTNDVGYIPFCDFPFYYNECYIKAAVVTAAPEDEAFENYINGCNEVKVAYSNQYSIYNLVLTDKHTPIEVIEMLSVASKHSFFTIDNLGYKTVLPVVGAEYDSSNYAVTPTLKLVQDNGAEINNCDC